MKTSLQAIHTRYHTAALGVPALILSGIGTNLGFIQTPKVHYHHPDLGCFHVCGR